MVCCYPPRKQFGMGLCVEYDTLVRCSVVISKKEDAQSDVLHCGLDPFQAITDTSFTSKHQTRTQRHFIDNETIDKEPFSSSDCPQLYAVELCFPQQTVSTLSLRQTQAMNY